MLVVLAAHNSVLLAVKATPDLAGAVQCSCNSAERCRALSPWSFSWDSQLNLGALESARIEVSNNPIIVARIWPTVTVSCWRLAANFVERRTERNLRQLDGDGCNHCLTFQRVSDYALPRSVQGEFLSTLVRAFACGGIMMHNMGGGKQLLPGLRKG